MASRRELEKLLEGPIYLAPNTFLHFYNGGKLRAEFMGEENPQDDYRSEEWIFSTNRAITPGRDNPPDKGISRIQLPSGEVILLTELLKAFPEETLGKEHYERFGPNVGILLKVFDVGDGSHIPVHWHPPGEFAERHLGSPFGKTEAWMVIGTRPGAKAWIGWKTRVGKEKFREWMKAQDVDSMRNHMHEVTPKVDDVYFLMAGIVHSIGSGVCVLELQEPTDWNILAEWGGEFPFGEKEAALGLQWDDALESADFSAMPRDHLEGYIKRKPEPIRREGESVEYKLLPEEARRYFWMTRSIVKDHISTPGDRGFHCLVTLKGEGKLTGPFGERPIKKGKSLFIPTTLKGYEIINQGETPLEVVSCYPPKP
ncbi:MAG: class I mannose-6-phosphate isomerase [Candidatus Bathyarchaeia archaeon]